MTRALHRIPLVAEGALEGTGSEVVFELLPVESFDAFYRRELPGLVALARALSGSSCADDIAQDSMLAAYRHWDTVASLEIPAAWVRRVCANRCLSTLRRRGVAGTAGVEPARVRRPPCAALGSLDKTHLSLQ